MPGLQLKQQKILEAILFAAGNAVPVAHLAKALECDIPAVRGLLMHMSECYEAQESGIQLAEIKDSFQLCTNPEYHEYAKKLLPESPKPSLTQPLLETLSIIAYKQPVTKALIEEIRGVSAVHAVNRLLEYGLVEELGRLDAPGKPILFGTSEDFLRYFGIRTVDEFLRQNSAPQEIKQTLSLTESKQSL
ncbi:MAG: SMC-Scp complex subunit ScpB [Defluviitaleaceae bacterium]|nr:SMC-Scp complex subunit ScpB [Defluviitaleaceae bacterium]